MSSPPSVPQPVARTYRRTLDRFLDEEIDPDNTPSRAKAGRSKLKALISGRNLGFLDLTTFRGAQGLISGRVQVTVNRLYDLGIAVAAAVLFDRVYVAYPEAEGLSELNAELGEQVFYPLNFNDRDIDEYLFAKWAEIINRLQDIEASEFPSELIRAWRRLLGVPEDAAHPHFEWGLARTFAWSPSWAAGFGFYRTYDAGKQALTFEYAAPTDTAVPSHELDEYVTLSTVRAFHNSLVSSTLGASYLPNALRGPIARVDWGWAEESRPKVNAALRLVASELGEAASEFPEAIPAQSPFLLATLFGELKQSRREDLPTALASIRDRGASYRSSVHRLTDAIDRGDIAEMKRIRRAISTSLGGLQRSRDVDGRSGRILDGVSAISVSITSNVPTLPPIARDVLTGLSLAPAIYNHAREPLTRLSDRLKHPYVRFLATAAASASHSMSLVGPVRKIWDYHLNPGEVSTISRIRSEYPFAI